MASPTVASPAAASSDPACRYPTAKPTAAAPVPHTSASPNRARHACHHLAGRALSAPADVPGRPAATPAADPPGAPTPLDAPGPPSMTSVLILPPALSEHGGAVLIHHGPDSSEGFSR